MANQDNSIFLVYGANWCPFCQKANKLLDHLNLKSYFFDAADDDVYLSEIKAFFDSLTVPVISRIDGSTGICTVVGGYTDLERYLESYVGTNNNV